MSREERREEGRGSSEDGAPNDAFVPCPKGLLPSLLHECASKEKEEGRDPGVWD